MLLPESALHELTSNNDDLFATPLIFHLSFKTASTFCGVLEFSAGEGLVYLPKWMFDQLGLTIGDRINVKSVPKTPPKGTFCKLQPQSVAFLDIDDPKGALEGAIGRGYVVLCRGDVIQFRHLGRDYKVEIQSVSPDDGRGVILVVETDLSVDFAPPVGYVETDSRSHSIAGSLGHISKPSVESSGFSAFSGSGKRLTDNVDDSTTKSDKTTDQPTSTRENRALVVPKGTIVFPKKPTSGTGSTSGDQKAADKFAAFSGSSRKLQ